MKQLVTEFTLALLVCWLAFAALSGCSIDEQQAYAIITGTKYKAEQPWSNRIPASVNKTKRGK